MNKDNPVMGVNSCVVSQIFENMIFDQSEDEYVHMIVNSNIDVDCELMKTALDQQPLPKLYYIWKK